MSTALITWRSNRLVREFQGFSRDLHDEAVRALVSSIGTPSSRLRSTVLDNLVHGRRLNRGNADPGTLEEDFSRLGLTFWSGLIEVNPSAGDWRKGLAALHQARNGLAHDDGAKIERVRAAGWPLRIGTVLRWRHVVDELTDAMDTLLSREIPISSGKIPW
jgi:hypothetical protein